MAKTIDFYGLEIKPVANGEAVTTLTPIGSFTENVEAMEDFIEKELLSDKIEYNLLYEIDYEQLISICEETSDRTSYSEAVHKEAQSILHEINGDSPGWAVNTKFYFHVTN